MLMVSYSPSTYFHLKLNIMKKTIYLLLACMFLSAFAVAQGLDYEYKQKFIIKNKKTGGEIITNFLAASAQDVISYEGMDDEIKIKRFGKDWKGGGLIVTFNNTVKLMSLTEFCKYRKLNNQLPIVLIDTMLRKFFKDTTASNVLLDVNRVVSFQQKRDSIFIYMNSGKRK